MNTEQNYVGRGRNAIPNPQTAQKAAHSITLPDERQTLQVPTLLLTPFQAALLFTAEKQHSKPGYAAFACYLNRRQVVAIERLHGLRGHNPPINLKSVISRFQATTTATGVILATWHHTDLEDPYADEFVDEVYRQYDLLSEAGIKLVDNLRLSETGAYSYYGLRNGPYDDDKPDFYERSLCRLY